VIIIINLINEIMSDTRADSVTSIANIYTQSANNSSTHTHTVLCLSCIHFFDNDANLSTVGLLCAAGYSLKDIGSDSDDMPHKWI
jgi:hypothetical protein